MKNALIRIKQYEPGASNAEKGVLRYIISNIGKVPDMNIHDLAKVSFCSASTIVRLCKKLGFDGYRDLQNSLLFELAVKKQNQEQGGTKIARAVGLEEIVSTVTQRNIASLGDTMKILEPDAIEKAVNILENCETIYLFGLGASLIVAQDAYLKFLRVGKPCFCTSDIHSQFLAAKNAKQTDAAIVLSYSGYTEEILKCVSELSANTVPIIAITRFDNSPLSQVASCNLYAVAMEEVYRSGAMSSRIAQLDIIDILYTAFINLHYDEYIRKIDINRIPKQMEQNR